MNSKKYILLVLSVAVFFACSCGKRYDARLAEVESLMNAYPDSALHMIERMSANQFKGEHNKAKYDLLYSQALYKNYIDVKNDSLISGALSYYKNHGSDLDKAKAFFYAGVICDDMGDKDEAMEYFALAKIHIEATEEDPYMRSNIYNALANMCFNQYDINTATGFYAKSVEYTKKAGRTDQLVYPLFGKIMCEIINGDYEAAGKDLDEAERIAYEYEDISSVYLVYVYRNITESNIGAGKSEISKNKQRLFSLFNEYNAGVVPVYLYNSIGTMYYKLGQLDSAKYYLERSLSSGDVSPYELGGYEILSKISEIEGDYSKALEYERIYAKLSNAHMKDKASMLQSLEMKHRIDYLNNRNVYLAARNMYLAIVSVLIIAIIVLVAFYARGVYRKRMMKKEMDIENLNNLVRDARNNYNELEDRMARVVKENEAMADKESRNAAVIEGMQDESMSFARERMESLKKIIEIASKCETRPQDFYDSFIDYLGFNYNSEDGERSLIDLTDYLYDNIMSRLSGRYPDLSVHELCYCALIYQGFSPQTIRMLYGYKNINSIYTMRSRIRSKLGLVNNAASLDEFLRNEFGPKSK